MSCGCQQFLMTGDCQCGDCPVFANAPLTGTGTSGSPLGVDFTRISKEEASFLADQICCSPEGTQVLGDCIGAYLCTQTDFINDLQAKIDINVDTVTYDAGSQTLVLTETDGTIHNVPLSDLVDVIVSSDAGNQIIAGSDGGAFFGSDQLCQVVADLADSGDYQCTDRQMAWYDGNTGVCGRMDVPCIPGHTSETVAGDVPAVPPATPPSPPSGANDGSEHYVVYDNGHCIYHLSAGAWALVNCIVEDAGGGATNVDNGDNTSTVTDPSNDTSCFPQCPGPLASRNPADCDTHFMELDAAGLPTGDTRSFREFGSKIHMISRSVIHNNLTPPAAAVAAANAGTGSNTVENIVSDTLPDLPATIDASCVTHALVQYRLTASANQAPYNVGQLWRYARVTASAGGGGHQSQATAGTTSNAAQTSQTVLVSTDTDYNTCWVAVNGANLSFNTQVVWGFDAGNPPGLMTLTISVLGFMEE